MHREVDDLGGVIGAAVSSITVHETICRVAEEVAIQLLAMAREAQDLVPSAVGGSGNERLKRLADRYTMQSERIVHEKITGAVSGPTSVAAAPAKAVTAEDDLGDNVDLF